VTSRQRSTSASVTARAAPGVCSAVSAQPARGFVWPCVVTGTGAGLQTGRRRLPGTCGLGADARPAATMADTGPILHAAAQKREVPSSGLSDRAAWTTRTAAADEDERPLPRRPSACRAAALPSPCQGWPFLMSCSSAAEFTPPCHPGTRCRPLLAAEHRHRVGPARGTSAPGAAPVAAPAGGSTQPALRQRAFGGWRVHGFSLRLRRLFCCPVRCNMPPVVSAYFRKVKLCK